METNAAGIRAGVGIRSRRAPLPAVYLATVAIDVFVLFVLLDLQMDRSLIHALGAAIRVLIGPGLIYVPLVAVAFIPALVLSKELVARNPPPTPLGRALAGAIAWAGWSALIGFAGSSLSGLVFFEASVFAGLLVLALSGALFAVLAYDRSTQRPQRGLITVAIAIVIVVFVGSLLTRGMWGGAA